jgi:hypothetical protein
MRPDRNAGAHRTQEPTATPAPDAIEIWGRRVGRTLGVCFLAILVINLLTHWFF